MTVARGLVRVEHLEVEALRAEAVAAGRVVLTLPDDIVDKASFFRAARDTLPLDPPAEGSWDALDDSLWEGLYQLTSESILIVWPDADPMVRCAPEDFRIAEEILADVASSLADRELTVGRPKDVSVIVGFKFESSATWH
ncbi:MAG: barstar family protein [Kofleriaceae bacterium]